VARTDLLAFEILKEVFFRYVTLRSGWEWELPLRPEAFREGSTFGDYANGLQWLLDGRVKVEGLYRVEKPEAAQGVYEEMAKQEGSVLTVVFDWR
jgi:threonine dehydrogenase-like Zn-dependent dehydrogenase